VRRCIEVKRMKKTPTPRERAKLVLDALAILYPDAHCALNHKGPLQLLVATILSAQCTDVRVNIVTPALFERFKTVQDYAAADLEELQDCIRTTGFFRNKAANIRECCRAILAEHDGEVPGTLEELVKLPGIGRKTANVILGDAFGVPGITVDTHVKRLSHRLGLTQHLDPVKIELALMKVIPQTDWTVFSHRTIFHGRQVCHARKPDCANCAMALFCPKIGVKRPATEPGHKHSTHVRES
jgi:endonuclease-3